MIKSTFIIDKLDSMYPSIAHYLHEGELGDLGYVYTQNLSTSYGIVLSGTAELPNGKTVAEGEFFSLWTKEASKITYTGKMVVMMRVGIKGINTIGGPIEERGRLSYIDGCSDTILIYPPRLGDPSLNHLHFPRGITQSFHTHPSIRIGVVVDGAGYARFNDNEDNDIMLTAGDMFCLDENEMHAFKTTGSHMNIVVFHPDGDWGPTDHNHIMKNRTYLTK